MAGGARHAAVKDVADNRHLQTFEGLLVAQNGVGIEQSLRGMLVEPVSGIDDGNVKVLCHDVRRAGAGVAKDNNVGAESAHSVASVEQRFALFNTRTLSRDQDSMRSQRLGGDFKRAPRAGGGLIEKKQHPPALEQGPTFVRIHASGKLQDFYDLGCFQVLNAEERSASWIHNLYLRQAVV